MIRNRSTANFSLLFGLIFTLIYDLIYLLLQYLSQESFIALLLLYCLCMSITPLYMRVICLAKDKRFFRIGVVLTSLIFLVIGCILDMFFVMLPAFLGVVSSVVFEKLYDKLKDEQFHSCISGVVYAVLVTVPAVVITLCAYWDIKYIGLLSGIAVFPISVIYYLISRIKCYDSHAFTVTVIVFLCAFSFPVGIIPVGITGYNDAYVLDYVVYGYYMMQIMICTIGVDLILSIINRQKMKKHQPPQAEQAATDEETE